MKHITFEEWFYGRRMVRFYECYVEGTNGGRYYRHYTLQDAQTEAERLARKEQGKAVYVFQCIGKCRAEPTPVRWKVTR